MCHKDNDTSIFYGFWFLVTFGDIKSQKKPLFIEVVGNLLNANILG
jgi:hypothetical protein